MSRNSTSKDIKGMHFQSKHRVMVPWSLMWGTGAPCVCGCFSVNGDDLPRTAISKFWACSDFAIWMVFALKLENWNFVGYPSFPDVHPRLPWIRAEIGFVGCGNFGCLFSVISYISDITLIVRLVSFFFDLCNPLTDSPLWILGTSSGCPRIPKQSLTA